MIILKGNKLKNVLFLCFNALTQGLMVAFLGICYHYILFTTQKLYESIRNEPFKIPEDDGNDLTHTFFNPDREGWLLKLGMSDVFYF